MEETLWDKKSKTLLITDNRYNNISKKSFWENMISLAHEMEFNTVQKNNNITEIKDDISIFGTDINNAINLEIWRDNPSWLNKLEWTGSFKVSLNGGNDQLLSANLKNSDEIDLGSGNDIIYIDRISEIGLKKLDGGQGIDTISFENSIFYHPSGWTAPGKTSV